MNPYQEGYTACSNYYTLSQNPYGYQTDFDNVHRAIAWNKGWEKGYEDKMLNEIQDST